MKWRCVNDPTGYCYKEPNWEQVEEERVTIDLAGKTHRQTVTFNRCKNNPKTCSYYQTFTQVCSLQKNIA